MAHAEGRHGKTLPIRILGFSGRVNNSQFGEMPNSAPLRWAFFSCPRGATMPGHALSPDPLRPGAVLALPARLGRHHRRTPRHRRRHVGNRRPAHQAPRHRRPRETATLLPRRQAMAMRRGCHEGLGREDRAAPSRARNAARAAMGAPWRCVMPGARI